jgi:hypothetical protein
MIRFAFPTMYICKFCWACPIVKYIVLTVGKPLISRPIQLCQQQQQQPLLPATSSSSSQPVATAPQQHCCRYDRAKATAPRRPRRGDRAEATAPRRPRLVVIFKSRKCPAPQSCSRSTGHPGSRGSKSRSGYQHGPTPK